MREPPWLSYDERPKDGQYILTVRDFDVAGDGRYKVMQDISDERDHQLLDERWTLAADDENSLGELALAASCYALTSIAQTDDDGKQDGKIIEMARNSWPFRKQEFKPKDRRRDLVRAAALIVAEIERIDRAAAKAGEVKA